MSTVVSDTVIYVVQANTPVQLDIGIGDGQAGGTSVLFRSEMHEIPGDGGLTLGRPGEDLRHRILHCVTTVRDVNTQTNRTTVTYTLSGGAATQSFRYSVEVPRHGEFAQYTIDFVFI